MTAIEPVNGQPVEINPLAMIDKAIASGMDPDRLGKLFDLAERWVKKQAAERYAHSIAAFQAECPAIHKGRQADRYAFANFDDIMRAAGPIMAKHGIAVQFTVSQLEAVLTITVRVRVGSHFEDYTFPSPVAQGVKLTAPQEYGMTLKYLQRYALCAALNIRTTDIVDNDGAGLVTAEDIARLLDRFDEAKKVKASIDWQKFLKWLQCDDLTLITRKQFETGMAWLDHIAKGGKA